MEIRTFIHHRHIQLFLGSYPSPCPLPENISGILWQYESPAATRLVCTWADLQNLQGGAAPSSETKTRWDEEGKFLCLSAPLVKKKIRKWNCDQPKKTQIVTKLKNSNCENHRNKNYHKTLKLTELLAKNLKHCKIANGSPKNISSVVQRAELVKIQNNKLLKVTALGLEAI